MPPSQPARRQSRQALSPPARPDADVARIATWNINGVRARAATIADTLDRVDPAVLLLQETKITELPAGEVAAWQGRGYQVHHVGAGGYNGVAMLTRWEPTDVVVSGEFGREVLDREPRALAARLLSPFGPMWAASVYVPNGRELDHWHYEYKLEFLAELTAALAQLAAGDPLIVGGDWNVTRADADVYDPRAFAGCTHVSPRERAALEAMLDGLDVVDLDAHVHGGDARRYTWWNYQASCYGRDRGLRIDLLCASEQLAVTVVATYVDHIARRGERPSDHAALVADLRVP